MAALATTRFASTEAHARHCEPAAPLEAGEMLNSVSALQGVHATGPESAKLLVTAEYEKFCERPAEPTVHETV